MDRREALKKLGAGGAIAAGASVVLGSTDVAYAASGPPTTGATFTLVSGGSNLAVAGVNLPAAPVGCTPTGYSWTLNSWDVAQGGSATISIASATTNPTLSLSKSKHGWGTGDWVNVTVTVSWSCGGSVAYNSGQLNYPTT